MAIASRNFSILITDELANQRIDKVIAQHPAISSRSQATHFIESGFVLRDGTPTKPAHQTKIGELYTINLPAKKSPSSIEPYKLKLDIAFEDKDIIVLNKPSGLVVHPAAGHYDRTLVNALLYHTKVLAKSAENRPGIVHRIDKDTSGLLVVCKNDLAMKSLSQQFAKKTVHRIYWSICYGRFKQNSGTIESFLRRHPKDRKRFASEKLHRASAPRGKRAITHYNVMRYSNSGFSLVHCQLETGRTHQIRVHLSELGHPIVADPIYCSPRRKNSIGSLHTRKIIEAVPHLILHAAELGFHHPSTNRYMEFKAPWPKELVSTIRTLELYDV